MEKSTLSFHNQKTNPVSKKVTTLFIIAAIAVVSRQTAVVCSAGPVIVDWAHETIPNAAIGAGKKSSRTDLPCQPRLEWQARLGGSKLEYLYVVCALADGGFILGGTSYSGADGNKTTPSLGSGDWWVVRLNSDHQIVWQRSFGSPGDDLLLSLEVTRDGGFILGGYRTTGAGWGFAVTRLDAQGNVLWERDYEDGAVSSIQQLPAGGFILSGWTYAGGVPGDDPELGGGGAVNFRIVRVEANGNRIWDRRFGGNAIDQGRVVRQTLDGGFIIGGGSNSGISGNKTSPGIGPYGGFDFWVIRLDAEGNKLWERAYGTDGWDDLSAIEVMPDGSFVLGGDSGAQFLLVGTGSDGSKQWEHSYKSGNRFHTMFKTSDGGFILGGETYTGSNNDDWVLIRTDAEGNQLWSQTFGGDHNDWLWSVAPTSDGGLMLAGMTAFAFGPNVEDLDQDYWLVKLALVNGDGVPGERDECPNTPPGSVVDAHGCSITQLCPCDGPWRNHGDYVRSVVKQARNFYRLGLITRTDANALITEAARSRCGQKQTPRPVKSAIRRGQ